MKREPVVTASTITAVVAAGLALAAAFGLHLSKEQTAAIMGAVALLAPIVAGFIGRQFVTPVTGGAEGMPFTGSHGVRDVKGRFMKRPTR